MKRLILDRKNTTKNRRLLFCNPLGATTSIWNELIEGFKDQFEFVLYDYPGFGNSMCFSLKSIQEYALLLDEAVQALPKKPTFLIGYSLGGWVAQQLILRKQIHFDGLILLATSQRVHPKGEQIMRQWQHILLHQGLESFLKELVLWSFSAEYFLKYPKFFSYLVEILKQKNTNSEAYLDQIQLALNYTQEQPIEQITIPTLIVEATNDILYPCFGAQELVTKIPNSHLVQIRAGHALLQENLNEVSTAMLSFIRSIYK